jgi:hypothetical protein
MVVVELARVAPTSMVEDETTWHAAAARFLLDAFGYGGLQGRVEVVLVVCCRR